MSNIRYDVQIYSSLNLQTEGGTHFINSDLNGNRSTKTGDDREFIHGSQAATTVRISENDGDTPNSGGDTNSQFDDGIATTQQFLTHDLTFTFANGSNDANAITYTFSAGSKVQSEHLYDFDEGYSISKIRIQADNGEQVDIGYVFIDESGSVVSAPPPGTELGEPSSRDSDGTVDWSDVDAQQQIVCFVKGSGTDIMTPTGPRSIENLRVGDLVTLASGGFRPILWMGELCVPREAAYLHRGLRPVVIPTGLLGNTRPLHLSRQHRWVMRSVALEVMTGLSEALAPAGALVEEGFAHLAAPDGDITYIHFALETHEVVIANGAPVETLLSTAPQVADLLGESDSADERHELIDEGALPILSMTEARTILSNGYWPINLGAGAPSSQDAVGPVRRKPNQQPAPIPATEPRPAASVM
ncbi:MAG: Hint domain-containing protein [Pseudomonadota bacterium]